MSYAIHTSVPASPWGMDLYGPTSPAPKETLTLVRKPPYLGEMPTTILRFPVKPAVAPVIVPLAALAPRHVRSLAHRIEGSVRRLAAGAMWAHHLAEAFRATDSRDS